MENSSSSPGETPDIEKPAHILLIEDSPVDVQLLRLALHQQVQKYELQVLCERESAPLCRPAQDGIHKRTRTLRHHSRFTHTETRWRCSVAGNPASTRASEHSRPDTHIGFQSRRRARVPLFGCAFVSRKAPRPER